jgi:hypothetical protein
MQDGTAIRKPHHTQDSGCRFSRRRGRERFATAIVLVALTLTIANCGTSGPNSLPSNIFIAIQPTNATLFLGQTQQFQASVTGTSNTAVAWSVNGTPGGSSSVGTVSATGIYTAPGVLPPSGSATITATSQADQSVAVSVTVMLQDDIVVTVSPPSASLSPLAAQVFSASLAATGNPSMSVNWSVNGIAGGNSAVGTIVASGASTATYTAPSAAPASPAVTVTATSVADPAKSGSATVNIECTPSTILTPPSASISLSQSQTFAASLCVATGSAITWDVNGVANGNNALGTIASTGTANAAYTAPADLPATDPVTIHATATSASGGTLSASATVNITSSISVSVTPAISTLALGQIAAFSATVQGTSDSSVTWSVNGIPNGNGTLGQICMNPSNPCVPPFGPVTTPVQYFAPALLPTVNPVTLTATSHADPTKSGTATIILTGSSGTPTVSIAPAFTFIAPSTGTLTTQQFVATVAGTLNTAVNWTLQSGVAGEGCAGAACGSVSATGLYTAPTAAPNPNAITVTATSVADSGTSGTATVVITSGPAIKVILPSSAMAGAVEDFPLQAQGLNFVPGSGGSASVLLLNGVAQPTTCANAETCTISLSPSQVQTAGAYTFQIQNPGPPAALSNPVPFVVVPFDVSQSVISLTPSAPVADSADITVFEPTTAAASVPLNVNFIGYLTDGNTCGVQGSPLSATRPASGTTAVNICVQGDGLDPSFNYAFTSPSNAPPGGDIAVTASAVTGLFPNMIDLQLQISNSTLPGVRSLIITDLNNNQAVATGMLEVY